MCHVAIEILCLELMSAFLYNINMGQLIGWARNFWLLVQDVVVEKDVVFTAHFPFSVFSNDIILG